MACSLNLTLTGPTIVTTPGIEYTYTVTGAWGCTEGTNYINTINIPLGWILISQTPVIGSTATFVVLPNSTPGTISVLASCEDCNQNLNLNVAINNTIQSNIGICCSNFATASFDTSQCSGFPDSFTVTITFGNQTDATAALGAYVFTSISSATPAIAFENLVSQINAAATANPSGNIEGLTPASFIAGVFSMVSFPTANDATPCGNTTDYPFGFKITYNTSAISCISNTANFSGGGSIINCNGPASITGSSFLCTGKQGTYTITFASGIPNGYVITPPVGWTVVSTVVSGPNTLNVTLLAGSNSGTLMVSYGSGNSGYSYSMLIVNDCFISSCASQMLLSQFCNDVDICCVECDDYKLNKKKIEAAQYNKAIAMITSYSLLKQNYFLNCNSQQLINIQNVLLQIQGILVRCGVCPPIN